MPNGSLRDSTLNRRSVVIVPSSIGSVVAPHISIFTHPTLEARQRPGVLCIFGLGGFVRRYVDAYIFIHAPVGAALEADWRRGAPSLCALPSTRSTTYYMLEWFRPAIWNGTSGRGRDARAGHTAWLDGKATGRDRTDHRGVKNEIGRPLTACRYFSRSTPVEMCCLLPELSV